MYQVFRGTIEWKIAIKTGLSGGLAFFLGVALTHWLHQTDVTISGLWTTLSAIVIQQTHLGTTYHTAWTRVLGVLLGCFMGGLFTVLFGSNPISLSISIILTIVACSLVSIKDSIRIACMSVAAVMVLWGLKTSISPWMFAYYRFIDSCVGVAVAVAVAHLLWPEKVSDRVRLNVAATLRLLKELYERASVTQPLTEQQEREFRTLMDQVIVQLWKNREILENSRMELLEQFSSLDEWRTLFLHLDLMLERVATLRRIYKTNLTKIMDEELEKYYQNIVEQTKLAFDELAEAMETLGAVPSLDKLRDASEALNSDLTRFRSMRITRNFELQDVEGFFVFIYFLRALADELLKTRRQISNL